ncbi:MAG: L,D-transpeptidase family protein [Bacillota bacterium]
MNRNTLIIFVAKLTTTALLVSALLLSQASLADAKPLLYPVPLFYGCDDHSRVLYLKTPPFDGVDVLELQERLYALGYLKVKSGKFDMLTYQALKKFQSKHHFAINGQVDDNTWRALSAGYEKPASGETEKAPQGMVKLVIDINKRTLTVYDDDVFFREFPVAVGKESTPTPVGDWRVAGKDYNWGDGFGSRWMGLNVPWGIFGIHGTNKPWSIGTFASGGCIRMHNEDVEVLFPWVLVGTPVEIVGNPIVPPYWQRRYNLHLKSVGPDVVQLQRKLKEHGIFFGTADGIFGPLTSLSVTYYQFLQGLEPTGKVDKATADALGLWEEMSNITLPQVPE